MTTKTKILLSILAVTSVVGVALATPIVGLLSPLLAVGNANRDLHARGRAVTSTNEPFEVRFSTDGASTVSIQDSAIAAGGHNGWHSHPGMVIVTIVSGSITWYDENCEPTNYKAGDSWVEGDKIHAYKVTSPTTLHAMATFVTAQGQALRTDEPAPPCDTGNLGL